MSKAPYFPLFIDDYLGATRHLTAEQHGAYLLLLMEAWRRPNCSLPDDDATLARLACMSSEQWQANRQAVMAFWSYDGRTRGWTQTRLKIERRYAADRSAKKRDAALKRWNKTENTDAYADASAMPPNPNPNTTYHTVLSARENELFEALGKHGKQRANGMFLSMSEPINWIANGCDFDLDILPVVRSLSQRANRVTSWAYFRSAVFEAKAKRTAPGPIIEQEAEIISVNGKPRKSDPFREALEKRARDLADGN